MSAGSPHLLVRSGGLVCALAIGDVHEVMRAQPAEPIEGLPPFVLGLAVIRGVGTPVVDLSMVLVGRPADAQRLVTVRAGERQVALAVETVFGVARLAPGMLSALPPLAGTAHHLQAVGALDGHMLALLETTRLVPEALWPAIMEGASA